MSTTDRKSTDRLSTTFAALADPNAARDPGASHLGEATVTELAEPFEMSLPAVSKHLKVLERAGLVARDARRSGVLSSQGRSAQGLATGWNAIAVLEQSLDRLDDYLQDCNARRKTCRKN